MSPRSPFSLVGVSLVVLISILSGVNSQCMKMKEIGSTSTVRCSKECVLETQDAVYGTLFYGEDSGVCRAALHAGAVNLTGGSVAVERTAISDRSIQGTCRNRVCSVSFNAYKSAYTVKELKEKSKVITQKVSGDVMLVHNNYHDNFLNILCLYETPNRQASREDMKSWKFEQVNGPIAIKEPSKVTLSSPASDNRHALHCMGKSPATDVFSPFVFPSADVQSTHLTWRANRGESFEVSFSNPPDIPKGTPMKRFPSKASGSVSMVFENASAEDSGLYLVGDNQNGAYFNVMVRECEEGKYGSECQFNCSSCLNGGVRHSYTGECLCPPGFMGDRCQRACPKGMIGSQCQFRCDAETFYFGLPEERTCKGLSICLPPPMGCSCPAGYKGPVCNEVCDAGEYGAGCLESCQDKCGTTDCDFITGKCPPSLPKDLRVEGNTTLAVVWNPAQPNSDEDSGQEELSYRVNYKLLTQMSCNYTEQMEESEETFGTRQPIEIPGLEAHASYNVCVQAFRASDSKTSPLKCFNVETGVEVPTLNVTELVCISGSHDTIRCSATLEGNCAHYNGPEADLVFSLASYNHCTEKEIVIEEEEPLSPHIGEFHSGIINHTFTDLQPGQVYTPAVRVHRVPVPEVKLAEEVLTHEQEPPPITEVNVEILSSSEVTLAWNAQCLPSGNELYFNIKVGETSFEDLTENDTRCTDLVDFSHCYKITDLQTGSNYVAEISVGAWDLWSKGYSFEFQVSETKPSKPQLVESVRHEKYFEVTLGSPAYPGGNLLNCSVTVFGETCVKPFAQNKPVKCKFESLEPGTVYDVEARCCNSKFCGDVLKTQLATVAKPEFNGTIRVLRTTNTTVHLHLPQIVKTGSADCHFVVGVEHLARGEEPVKDLEAEIGKLLKGISQRCINCNNPEESVWIAAVVSSAKKTLEVGDGDVYGGYYNRPLKLGESYKFGILGITDIEGIHDEQKIIWEELRSPVRVEVESGMNMGNMLVIMIVLIAILFILALILAIIIFRKPKTPKEEEMNVVKFTKEEEGGEQ